MSESNTVPTEDATTPEAHPEVVAPISENENPIEEAKKLLEDNKKMLEELREERKKIEKATANMIVSGKGYASKEKTKEDIEKDKAQNLADEITKNYIKK